MLGPCPGVHLFCPLVAGIKSFINEIYVHKKILLVNCLGISQRSDLFLFVPTLSGQTNLLPTVHVIIYIYFLPILVFQRFVD